MIDLLRDLIVSVIKDLIQDPHDTIGLILFFLVYNTVIVINLVYKAEWDLGSKGTNKFWDLPEQIATQNKWYFPPIIIGACFLPQVIKVPDMVWFYMFGITFAAMFGRWGLEWLERVKGGITSVFNKKTEIKTEINEQQSQVDTTDPTSNSGK